MGGRRCAQQCGRGASQRNKISQRGWASSQVTLSILLFCPLWVALVPSGCLWCRENKIAIKFVTPAWDSLRRGRDTRLTDRYLGVNLGVRRLKGHSNHANAEVLQAFDLWVAHAGIVKDLAVLLRRFVLMLTSVSQWVNNTTEPNRDANAGEYTRENLLHERI